MKVKKSKHVHHYRDGYTPVVRCHLSRRHKVAGTDKDAWCTGVSVAYPQKIDIEKMALDISNATTATPTDVKLVWAKGNASNNTASPTLRNRKVCDVSY